MKKKGYGEKSSTRNAKSSQNKSLYTRRLPHLEAKTDEQREAIKTFIENDITFLYGIAGSGKTHLSVVYGLIEFCKGNYDKIIFTRPCVEAHGEKLGSLPGTANEKISPYMMPIFDILEMFFTKQDLTKMVEEGIIMTLPLAFLRGITFRKSFVVGDEFQNATPKQVRLFLTRIGEGSKIVVTGDLNQSDINGNNGLKDAISRFRDVNHIGICKLTEISSSIRHPLIETIEKIYYKND